MTLEVIFLISIIFLGASIIKGIAGFGTALFAMPLLTAFFLAPETARPLIVTVNLMLNAFILIKEKKLTLEEIKPLKSLVISGFIAALLTGFLFPRINMETFNILLGALLVFTALNKLFKVRFVITHPKRYFIPMGILGGMLNTLIGAGGVPVLIFFSNTYFTKENFRKSIMLFFFVLNVGSIISFILNGTYPVETAYTVLIFTPIVLIGGTLGMISQRYINERAFQIVVSLLLLAMGLNSMFTII